MTKLDKVCFPNISEQMLSIEETRCFQSVLSFVSIFLKTKWLLTGVLLLTDAKFTVGMML